VSQPTVSTTDANTQSSLATTSETPLPEAQSSLFTAPVVPVPGAESSSSLASGGSSKTDEAAGDADNEEVGTEAASTSTSELSIDQRKERY